MIFIVYSTSDHKHYQEEIATLDDLLKFVKDNDNFVIISTDNDPPTLEIYDDYRE